MQWAGVAVSQTRNLSHHHQMMTDIIAAVLVTAIALAAIRWQGFFHPSLPVAAEFWFTALLMYVIWDYTGAEFGMSFYLWLAIKDTLFAITMILVFRRLSLWLVVACYIIAAMTNGVFVLNEWYYLSLDAKAQYYFYDTYRYIYDQYLGIINATMAGQIAGLLFHDAGGLLRRIRRVLYRYAAIRGKPVLTHHGIAKSLSGTKRP